MVGMTPLEGVVAGEDISKEAAVAVVAEGINKEKEGALGAAGVEEAGIMGGVMAAEAIIKAGEAEAVDSVQTGTEDMEESKEGVAEAMVAGAEAMEVTGEVGVQVEGSAVAAEMGKDQEVRGTIS